MAWKLGLLAGIGLLDFAMIHIYFEIFRISNFKVCLVF